MSIAKRKEGHYEIMLDQGELEELAKLIEYGIDHANEYGVRLPHRSKEFAIILKAIAGR